MHTKRKRWGVMTDNEIIKCLRHCRAGDCENCKALNVCDATFSFHKETLDLIKRLKMKNKELDERNVIYRGTVEWQAKEISRQKAENERLQKNIDGLNIFTKNHIKVIRLQAIKEFAKELKNCFAISGDYLDIINIIDNLVKEMTEENEK